MSMAPNFTNLQANLTICRLNSLVLSLVQGGFCAWPPLGTALSLRATASPPEFLVCLVSRNQ